MTILLMSARSTQLNQMDESLPIVTSPIRQAVGAIQAVGSMSGVLSFRVLSFKEYIFCMMVNHDRSTSYRLASALEQCHCQADTIHSYIYKEK